jgi:hypothetical protein
VGAAIRVGTLRRAARRLGVDFTARFFLAIFDLVSGALRRRD